MKYNNFSKKKLKTFKVSTASTKSFRIRTPASPDIPYLLTISTAEIAIEAG
jgi:hypothetical protein